MEKNKVYLGAALTASAALVGLGLLSYKNKSTPAS